MSHVMFTICSNQRRRAQLMCIFVLAWGRVYSGGHYYKQRKMMCQSCSSGSTAMQLHKAQCLYNSKKA